MVDINEVYKSNSAFIKAEDLGDDMPIYTIASADVKNFDNGDRKIVVEFRETEKSLPLNMTNARAIGEMYGGDTDGWINRRVMLFSMPTDFQGKTVMAVRLRRPPQQQSQPAQSRPAQNAAQYDERNPPPRDYLPADDIPFGR